jgi:hypothetical protein
VDSLQKSHRWRHQSQPPEYRTVVLHRGGATSRASRCTRVGWMILFIALHVGRERLIPKPQAIINRYLP